MEQEELIKVKIKKIKALAEQGVGGEKEAARKLLLDLCVKYGIELEELNEEEARREYVFKVRTSVHHLFAQCYVNLYGVGERFREEVHIYKNGRGYEYSVMLTPTEYIEFNLFWEWHRQNFLKERKKIRKLFYDGYLSKHKLYPCSEDEDFKNRKREPMSYDDMLKVAAMANICEDVTFHKQIEGGNDLDDED